MSFEAYERVGPTYLQYYTTQRGRGDATGLRVFRGAERWRPRQHGDGFGSILRGLARFVLPVLGRGIGAFASHTMDATNRGVSLGEAAKSALKPTLRAVVDAGAGQMASFQGGNGDKKRLAESGFYERMQEAKRRKKHGKKSHKAKKVKQSGEGKKTRKAKKVKQSGEGKKNKTKKQSGTGKKRKAKQSGKGKLSKKHVYKKSAGSFNF
jgi:hypothetical protein